MNIQASPLVSTLQQLLEKEAECRRKSTLQALTPERRAEFKKLADYWAQLAEAADE
jgi:hypothetical protein